MSVSCYIQDNEDWDLGLDVAVVGKDIYLRIEEVDGNNFTGTRRKVLGQVRIPMVDLVKSIQVAMDADQR